MNRNNARIKSRPDVVTWVDQFTLSDTDLQKKIQQSKKLKPKDKNKT